MKNTQTPTADDGSHESRVRECWVDAATELPKQWDRSKNSDYYLCCNAREQPYSPPFVAYYDGNDSNWYPAHPMRRVPVPVSHWMTLPALPNIASPARGLDKSQP